MWGHKFGSTSVPMLKLCSHAPVGFVKTFALYATACTGHGPTRNSQSHTMIEVTFNMLRLCAFQFVCEVNQ